MKINRLLATVAVLALCLGAWAQNATLTPYSRYGYGMLSENATSAQRAMGGVGFAMNSGRQINVMNPASYAAIDSLTFLFDMGVNFNTMWFEEGDVREDHFSGGLDYITMAFPIAKRIGGSLGLLPYSTTGYSFADDITNGSVARAGNGNINQLYIGVGVEPIKNLYVGANFAYLFGTTINDLYAYTITGSTTLFERYMRIRDWRLDIGAQYDINVNPDNKLTLGFNFSPAKDFHGETYGIYYDASLDTKADTTGYTKLKGKYSAPATYGAGVSYTWRQRLMVEVDFTYQPWKNAKYATLENFESSEFDNRWKIAGGLQYIPAPRGSWIQRVQYRAGAYYNHDYLKILGNNLREIGASIGFGLPVPSFKTMINLTFEYKHRQAHPDPLVKEQYFNISLGVNFNEMWFRKSKIY
ncbi:MAG: hypothetical protein LUD17_00900 [Bacteroidales bacterium]|nr:hypothetical protein [Bacteroidales bacterium]